MEEQETILIVDDNSTNLRVLVDYLRGCGYKTLVATSGERALTQLERNTPDLILLDV
ncbi:MAG: response regulator, partial [Caldilineaceae bacterium]|nr:response regulator [Caldilineaceae bacterium]